MALGGVQRAGLPAHVPVQHWSFAVHGAPAATHAEVQTATPPSAPLHAPSQHVSPVAHGAPRGRHGPAPKSQRPLVWSQSPQHGGTLFEVHASPGARQRAAAKRHRPISVVHSPEQQSPFVAHAAVAIAQTAGPQRPALQPSEQQSEARAQGAPSTRQYGAHWFESDPSTGLQRPLQQSLREEHSAPAPLQDPAARQVPSSQRPEQQSELAPHAAPSARQVAETGAAGQLGASGDGESGASARSPPPSRGMVSSSTSSRPHAARGKASAASHAATARRNGVTGSSRRSRFLPGSRPAPARRRPPIPRATAGSGAPRAPLSRATRRRRPRLASRGSGRRRATDRPG